MLSDVAAIVNKRGRWRVVVAPADTFHHHVGKNERVIQVPGLQVQEPVPFEEISTLIEKVRVHLVQTLTLVNHCGDCAACCVLPYMKSPEFEKPSGVRCHHLCKGGCDIYKDRPKVCRDFVCTWLSSQSRNDKMPASLRPDRCGAFFHSDTETGDPLIIEVHGEPNIEAVHWLTEMQRLGYKAKKITHYTGE